MKSLTVKVALKLTLLLVAASFALPLSAQTNAQQRANDQREQQIREHEIQMKNTDLERLRNRDPKAAMEQANEDFGRLKVLNAEVIAPNAGLSVPDLKAVAQAAEEVRKRALRLKANLALPAGKAEKPAKNQEPAESESFKSQLSSLNSLIQSFAANPIFKNTGTVDPQSAAQARRDLDSIIYLSEKVKKSAEKMGKAEGKSN